MARFLTIHETDGYVLAAERGMHDSAYFYHPDCRPDCRTFIVTLPHSADALIDRLCAQGTPDQHYADGYKAWDALVAVAPHASAIRQRRHAS